MHGGRLVRRALRQPSVVEQLQRTSALDVVAAGKAAGAMLAGWATAGMTPRHVVGIGPDGARSDVSGVEWFDAGHPLPNEGSVRGARRALELAIGSKPGELLVVLLSGGASALMAMPARGLALTDKQAAAHTLMAQGADIGELNTVRKHLSAIKGGRLAAAAGGDLLALVLSDVVGDDLSVIASGPTVADASTYAQAMAILSRRGGTAIYPPGVVAHLRRGAEGLEPETPKPGDPRLDRATTVVIGRQRGAVEGARQAAAHLGYATHVIDAPVTGEARDAARAHVGHVASVLAGSPGRPACIISSGETTVTVRGTGKGGRNQEFAFALAQGLSALGGSVVAASVGTDGIDGPTDAAGAIVDQTTFARAQAAGVRDPVVFLENNDTYAFFDRLGDLIRTGPTSTNVGDVQVVLVA